MKFSDQIVNCAKLQGLKIKKNSTVKYEFIHIYF
jgi:hypothetical protein